MPELTIERLFSEPDLTGAVPSSARFSPDGRQVTYLVGFEVQDLWVYDLDTSRSRMLVEASSLSSGRVLSDEEKARRERKRITQGGIVEYFWHPDGKRLLFPLEGVLYLYDIASEQLVQLTSEETFETDVRFSPDGRYLSFIRDKDIFIVDIETGTESQLTSDGSDTVSNGLAEFIAQEEMHRYDGYWWSPDSSRIAFIQVDESPVALTQRYEIDADSFSVFDQRYPYAGTPNADVRVGILELDGKVTWVEIDRDPDSYLARINWFSDNEHLAVQVQSRNQQRLDLVVAAGGQDSKSILTETSDTWINLNNHFRALKSADEFIWGSERDGYCHLYKLSTSGEIRARLTEGEWQVGQVLALDEENNSLFFEGFADTPLERHLYVVSLDGETAPTRLTTAGHSHSVEVAPDCQSFLDRYSAVDVPPSLALVSIDGTQLSQLSDNQLNEDHAFAPYIAIRGQVSFGTIDADDGQQLQYRLVKPSGSDGRCPLLLTVYGGPGVQRVTNEWLTPWHHFMSSRGYGLLQLDNRGTTNRGKAFEDPIYRRLGVVEVADQLKGIEFACEQAWIDRDRIGVFGHSYGGYMTLMLMAKAPDIFRAGISVAPVTDWQLYDTHYTERYLGDPNENAEGYEQSSVFPFVDDISGKLLLIHGMADDNVLFTNTTRLMKTLQDKNMQFDLMAYPGAKHGIAGRTNSIHRYTLMTEFLDRHLKSPA